MFVFAIILIILAVIAGLVMLGSKKSSSDSRDHYRDDVDTHRIAGVSASVLTVLAVIALVVSSLTVVSTKNVGIVTSFGSPVNHLSNGLHFKAPWQKVTELDAAIQTDNHTRDNNKSCIPVRIAHQAVACVDASIRWRINENAADELFRDYKDFDRIRDSLVTRELNAALNTTLESYDPLSVDNQGNSNTPNLNDQSTKVTSLMQGKIGNQVTILSVFIPVLHFDDETQGRINALQAQIAQTRIAAQAEQTATKQAAANRALSSSVSNDPNVLVNKCFDLLNEMVSKNQQIPTGFSCWPGGSSAVVVPSASAKK